MIGLGGDMRQFDWQRRPEVKAQFKLGAVDGNNYYYANKL